MILFLSQKQANIIGATCSQKADELTGGKICINFSLFLTKKNINAFVGYQTCQYYFSCWIFINFPEAASVNLFCSLF